MSLATPPAPAILVEDVTKSFGGVPALNAASLRIESGEVHALLGINGSGKSTLAKVLAGFHVPESGSVEVFGEALRFGSASASHAAGLRFVHQDMGLIDSLSVEENLNLTMRRDRLLQWVSPRKERLRARALLAKYDLDVDPAGLVADLGPTERTILAIARAVEDQMAEGQGIVVLDEPTAALPSDEVQRLFDVIAKLKASGITIIYVSHRMPEILLVADRLTVLRDGRVAASAEVAGLSLDRLIELVVGYHIRPATAARQRREFGAPVLVAKGVSSGGVRDFSVEARAGEVVGVTGLLGSGFEQVLGAIFGSSPIRSGTIELEGKPVSTSTSIRKRIVRGLTLAPADRRRLGSIAAWTVRENLTLPAPGTGSDWNLVERRERKEAIGWLQRLTVQPSDPERLFATLSGGNQQKVVISRWLRVGAKALMLDEPTNGVDAGAKVTIHQAISDAAAQGSTVLIASSDVEELIQVCDRVLVMGGGEIRSELTGEQLTDAALNTAILAATR